jgi:hypothetical protein
VQNSLTIVYRYRREDLLRILRLTVRQLASWEKAGLVAAAETYSFFDLLQIKKVRDLCAKKVRPAVIRQSLEAMQKQVAGMENPLLEAGTAATGHRVTFRHQGRLLEPIAGQFVFDFSPQQKVVASKSPVKPLPPPPQEREPVDVASLFAKGIALEEDTRTHSEAIATYLKVLELEPNHAAAHINVGTLYYITATPLRRTRATPSPTSTWAMCSMRQGGLRKPSRVIRSRCNWPRPTPTRTTTWPLRSRR